MKISIIIPAYNEEGRIKRTLLAYNQYFEQIYNKSGLEYELLVVVNATTDGTITIIRELQNTMPALLYIDMPQGGKGYAIIRGFNDALTRDNDLIGFVDADMATAPQYFYELVLAIPQYDGIIASRYMPGSVVTPPRPLIKRWGSKLFFDSLRRLLFGLYYYDTQCGAKLFKRHVIEKILPYLSQGHWTLDVEILYLCKHFGFSVREIPTTWHDQAGSKLKIFSAGSKMLSALVKLRWQHRFLK